jgi:CubicO group peptidase (beta-lactamase class C family)
MKNLRTISNLLAMLCLCMTASAQTTPAALDTLLSHTLDSMRVVTSAKSLSAAIQLTDGAIWKHAKGISSVSPDVSVTTDDAFLIGSVAKTLTAGCILQLADENILTLDDGIYEWLDTMPHVNPNITIRQLMQHTSGLYDVLSNPSHQDSLMADPSRIWTPEELIERFMDAPLFAPGTSWSYCNTNYFLLGMIIKAATGQPFYTEIRNRFFVPLGLNHIAIPAFEPLSPPVAHLWLDINGDGVSDDANDFYMSYMALNSTAGAAGGYFSTPSDCTRWMRKYMRGDLISAANMAQVKTTVSAPASQGGFYGLGLMKNNFLGHEAYGHGGDLAYHASSWYFPDLDISITVCTNDNEVTSWDLLPVVRELLRTYDAYLVATGIEEEGLTSSHHLLQAFPNPFADKLNAQYESKNPSDKVSFQLTDALGRSVSAAVQQTNNSQHYATFNGLNQLTSGMYFLTASVNGERRKTIKVVK